MTQRNIDTMDIIVNKIADGAKLSEALKFVYDKRNVCIPYVETNFDESLMSLGMTSRTTNALMRAGLRTIGDVVNYCNTQKITTIKTLGNHSGIEVFETILDYCWECMSYKEKATFLIDTVERNSINLRKEIA